MKYTSFLLALFCFTSTVCMDNPNPDLPPLTEYAGWTTEKMEAAWQEFQPLLEQYKTNREALSLDNRYLVARVLQDQEELALLKEEHGYGRPLSQLNESEKQQELSTLATAFQHSVNPNHVDKTLVLAHMHHRQHNPCDLCTTESLPQQLISHYRHHTLFVDLIIRASQDEMLLPFTQLCLKHGAHVNPEGIQYMSPHKYISASPLLLLIGTSISSNKISTQRAIASLLEHADLYLTIKHPHLADYFGDTDPLYQAINFKADVGVIKLLLKYKAGPNNIVCFAGFTRALGGVTYKGKNGHPAYAAHVARLIFEAGGDPEIKNSYDISPLDQWPLLGHIWQKVKNAREICVNTFLILRGNAKRQFGANSLPGEDAILEYVYNNEFDDLPDEIKIPRCRIQRCEDTDAWKAVCSRMQRPFRPYEEHQVTSFDPRLAKTMMLTPCTIS